VRHGDYLYVLAPPERAQALDRFFVDMPPPSAPDPRLLGDFYVAGDVTLGALADVYGLPVEADAAPMTLADHFARRLGRAARPGDALPLGLVHLIVHQVAGGRVTSVGLQLADPEPVAPAQPKAIRRIKAALRRVRALMRRRGRGKMAW